MKCRRCFNVIQHEILTIRVAFHLCSMVLFSLQCVLLYYYILLTSYVMFCLLVMEQRAISPRGHMDGQSIVKTAC